MSREKMNTIDTAFAIALLCMFAASVLMVLLLGTRIYTSMTTATDDSYNERTCLSYIAEKLRHGDKASAVSVGTFDGLNAMMIETEDNHTTYETILYYYDGWLRELFFEKGTSFLKTDGTKIIEAQSVKFTEVKSGLFSVKAVDLKGNTSSLNIFLRSEG